MHFNCKQATTNHLTMKTCLSIEDHLISFSVLNLVVEIFWQLQAFFNLSFKTNSALQRRKPKKSCVYLNKGLCPERYFTYMYIVNVIPKPWMSKFWIFRNWMKHCNSIHKHYVVKVNKHFLIFAKSSDKYKGWIIIMTHGKTFKSRNMDRSDFIFIVFFLRSPFETNNSMDPYHV